MHKTMHYENDDARLFECGIVGIVIEMSVCDVVHIKKTLSGRFWLQDDHALKTRRLHQVEIFELGTIFN